MSELICPKCHANMRTYERNGVHIDQCTECRGIFLDRGELEHLTAAESSWSAGSAPAAPAPQSSGYSDQKKASYPKKKKRSFFEDLFE